MPKAPDIPINEVMSRAFARSWARGQAIPSLSDPYDFIFSCCHTVDEAEQDPALKIKLIPDLPHVRLHIDRRLVQRLHPLLQPKSRRMIVTWLCTAEEVWGMFAQPHTAVALQSN